MEHMEKDSLLLDNSKLQNEYFRYGKFRGKSIIICGIFLVGTFMLLDLNPSIDNEKRKDKTEFFPLLQRNENKQILEQSLTTIATVYLDEYGQEPSVKFGLEDKEQGQAIVKFEDTINQIGWGQLWIESYPSNTLNSSSKTNSYENTLAALYAAGYAEGALTHRRIYQHFNNTYTTFFGDKEAPLRVQHFFVQNLRWIRLQVELHTKLKRNKDSDLSQSSGLDIDYWHTIGGILAQFDGLVAGYNKYCKKEHQLDVIDLYLLNADGDLEDLIPAMNHSRTRTPGSILKSVIHPKSYEDLVKSLKCSAVIRITSNKQDLLWGHATWDQYSAMNRIFKHYDLPIPILNNTLLKRRKVSFSSSPGYLASVDDFYMLNSGINVMETTNGIYRDSLYDLVVPQSVLTWMRSLTANFLSATSLEWAENFKKFNSGTYNNQWMILNLAKFTKGKGLSKGGLIVLEQMPGFIQIEDLSDILNLNGYWASYNIPFFSNIYIRTGFMQMYETSNFSSHWSHTHCPRAKIFRREAKKIETLNDLKKVIRWNHYKKDPASNGHASLAIAARYDLEIDDSFSLNGAIDAKVATYKAALHLECEAISGPTSDNQPPFTWKNSSLPFLPHKGHPNTFNFSFIKMKHYRSLNEN